MLNQNTKTSIKTTSIGHSCSEASWLDVHFAAAQPEYEAMLQLVGLKSGWRVLDAGCLNRPDFYFREGNIVVMGQVLFA